MRRLIIILIGNLICFTSSSQGLLLHLDSLENNKHLCFNFLKTKNVEINKTCYVINIRANNFDPNYGQPLYVIKIFADSIIKIKREQKPESQIDSLIGAHTMKRPERRIGLKIRLPDPYEGRLSFNTVKDKIDSILRNDQLILVQNLLSKPLGNSSDDYQILYDQLSIILKDSILFFNGSALLQYFSVMEFNQISPLQSTLTVFNTKAQEVKIQYSMPHDKDSIPLYPLIANSSLYRTNNKMYLTKRIILSSSMEYLFCRLLSPQYHPGLGFSEFFRYQPEIGIKEFTGIYAYNKNQLLMRVSEKAYEFKFVEYLKF